MNEMRERNVPRLHGQTETKVKNKMNFNRDNSNFRKYTSVGWRDLA